MRAFLPLPLFASLWCLPAAAQPAAPAKPRNAHQATKPDRAQPTQLPVTHVSLYKNGIGFFEHTGRVSGDQSVTLDLTSAQLNDVLQTITAIDLNGGRITGAVYNSTTPVEQQLRALPLSLGERPTEQDLFNALRGARVEVTGSGSAFTGRVLSFESRRTPEKPDQTDTDRYVLTVVAEAGATRTLLLNPSTTVRLLDSSLRTDLNTYLQLLGANRTDGIRHLTLTDHGPANSQATRELRVSFLSEVPVWKSTYRVLITDSGGAADSKLSPAQQSATLQGYSVVDNTTGEDWNHVRLSLIAGNPQSFLQPLAQPIYHRRLEIPIAENAQLTPQTHESGITMLKEDSAPPQIAGVAGMSGMAGGSAGGALGGVLGGVGTAPLPVNGRIGSSSETVAVSANEPLIPYETIARASTVATATSTAFDDFFSYTLADPVTIPRNGSALVPILQVQLPTERVTLWSPSAPTPLRAVWLTNSSDLTLDRGSFSIVENGAFAGEGLLEPIHPGERRLLSYAADQAVRVSVDNQHDTSRVTTISVSKGVLRAANTEVAEVEYLVQNAAPESRTVIVEEPRRSDWTLDSDPAPSETTPASYRFRVVTKPHETVRLHIGQRHTFDQLFRLVDSSEERLTVYLRNNSASPTVFQQLQPIFAAKRNLSTLDLQINDKQTAIKQLFDDQKRLRDNLAALKGSSEERSLARRYTAELNTQEDALTGLRNDLGRLQQERMAAEADLSTRIESLQISDKS